MVALIRRYWFIVGLLLVLTITVADTTVTISRMGEWLKYHHGPGTVIFLIFFISGLVLDAGQIKAGVRDIKGVIIAMGVIFLVAPMVGALFSLLTWDTGILIGIFLVAVMPTTLSSGVIMTGAAGGNMAHALFITILSNGLAVFTIPVTLALLLNRIGGTADIAIDKGAIMIKIALLVLAPLTMGLILKCRIKSFAARFHTRLQTTNQCLVLGIVWMAVSQARGVIVNSGHAASRVVVYVIAFHGLLLAIAGLLSLIFKLGRGRRESVLFMGSQKTLPLSVILQVSLFPQYGMALVVCVLHHIIHLVMDGYLVARLKQ